MTEPTEFTVHHLRFDVEALTPLLLPAQAGPSIRGALFGALQRHFCPVPRTETPTADHKAVCPVCWLMATELPDHHRGRDVPRPYVVEPPLPAPDQAGSPQRYEPGQRFTLGLSLFARAVSLFPYLVVALPLMGQEGIGLPLPENAPAHRPQWARRGQFALRAIHAVQPLSGQESVVLAEGDSLVIAPEAPLTDAGVAAACDRLLAQIGDPGLVQIEFLTPTRIVQQGRLVRGPSLGPLVRRLLERLDALRTEYAAEPPLADRDRLIELADSVRRVRDHTRWIEVDSHSQRLKRSTPRSGFLGAVTYQAEAEVWRALLPPLLWGQAIHVGKNATKGDGWYRIQAAEEDNPCPSSSI